MAVLSELYFKTADTDWTYDGQQGSYRKLKGLFLFLPLTSQESILSSNRIHWAI